MDSTNPSFRHPTRQTGRSQEAFPGSPQSSPLDSLQDKSNSVVAISYDPTAALHFTNLNGRCIGIFFGIKSARQRAYELRSMPIHEVSQLHVFIEFHYYRLPFHAVLQITARLTPSVFVDDIGERNTADWPEPAHRIADRQQGIRMDAGRQPERGLRFFLELQVQRRQSRAEAERSRRQQHVLNGWIDRRPGSAGRCSAFEAGNDPHRGLVDVVGEIFAAASILSNRSRLVPGAGSPDRYRGATCSSHARLYKAPTVSLTFGSRITRKRQRCIFPPLGAQTPASRIFRISSFGTGSGFSRRIDRVVLMISNRSVAPGISSAMACSLNCHQTGLKPPRRFNNGASRRAEAQ